MRSPSTVASAWSRALVLLFAVFASLALADVKFTEPAAGANLTAGQIDVQWKDSGISPPIDELTQYTLSLMVGGNDLNDMQPVATFESQGTYSAAFSAHGTIPEGIAADIPNGFFFRMTSTKEAGGVLINYSDRFSISGLTGDTALRIRQAAQALNGDTDGPPAEGNDASSTSSYTISSIVSTTASGSSGSLTTAEVSTTTHFTSTEASDPASEPTDSPDDDDTSSGLSTGATAGIAVAVTLAVIAVCAALAWSLYIRHRKRQNEVHEIAPGTIFHHKPMSELSAEELVSPKTFWTHTSELSSESMVHEAGSGERPPELDHMSFRAELEGSQPTTPK